MADTQTMMMMSPESPPTEVMNARSVQTMCQRFAADARDLSPRMAEARVVDCLRLLSAVPASTEQLELACVKSLVLGLHRRPLETSTLLNQLKERRRALMAALRRQDRAATSAQSDRLLDVLGEYVGRTDDAAAVVRLIADQGRAGHVDALGCTLANVDLDQQPPR